ncbi:MAG: metal-dependent phosphoesterase [Paenibacillaceae bacterium]|jgi:predicted metal-dependent phosphoesterase TrpH|nr:metal-dependent phosphoesterase [Paenibacillaceae bacterium]
MMNERYVDLHTHTIVSDGTGTPADNVRLAREAGLYAVAITDHDTIAGLKEAEAAGQRLGVVVVPGVELSTVAEGKDIHVLGYYMDTGDDLFLSRLEELRSVRDIRNEMMVSRLRELGMAVTMEELQSRRGSGGAAVTVGRPHIAGLLVEKGYAVSLRDAFDRYLGEGAAAYVNPPRIRPETAVEWIHEAGGAAVLAHPGLYGKDALVEKLAAGGLDGIEAYHSDHCEDDVERYLGVAKRHGLLVTAGSDYHGERNGAVFHGALGSRRISTGVLEELKTRAAAYRMNR